MEGMPSGPLPSVEEAFGDSRGAKPPLLPDRIHRRPPLQYNGAHVEAGDPSRHAVCSLEMLLHEAMQIRSACMEVR